MRVIAQGNLKVLFIEVSWELLASSAVILVLTGLVTSSLIIAQEQIRIQPIYCMMSEHHVTTYKYKCSGLGFCGQALRGHYILHSVVHRFSMRLVTVFAAAI